MFRGWVIDPTGDRAVYKQIADRLRAAITNGVLGPGEQLPSEHELVAEYGVARGAARQAIMLLRNEGLIEAVHGLGCPSRSSGCVSIASRMAGRSAATLRTRQLTMSWMARSGSDGCAARGAADGL